MLPAMPRLRLVKANLGKLSNDNNSRPNNEHKFSIGGLIDLRDEKYRANKIQSAADNRDEKVDTELGM